MANLQPLLEAGQIWADKDKRRSGRTFVIESFNNAKAVCRLLTQGLSKGKSKFYIKIDRFKPKNYAIRNNTNNQVQSVITDAVKTYDQIKDSKSLIQRCEKEWLLKNTHSWTAISDKVAKLSFLTGYITVREVSEEKYDIKLFLMGKMVMSEVMVGDLADLLNDMYNLLIELKDDIAEIV